MEQQRLFYDFEDIYEAMKADCRAIGAKEGSAKAWSKVVGHLLFPEKQPDDAGKLLNNCLDGSRQEKISPEQFMLIIRKAREAGSYITMHYLCADAGFTQPEPTTPEDEQSKLMREFIATADKMECMLHRLNDIRKKRKS